MTSRVLPKILALAVFVAGMLDALAVAALNSTNPCDPNLTTASLLSSRFLVQAATASGGVRLASVRLTDHATDGSGPGVSSAAFCLANPESYDVGVKVLDATRTSGHFWVFGTNLSGQTVMITVTDRMGGGTRIYKVGPLATGVDKTFPTGRTAALSGASSLPSLIAGFIFSPFPVPAGVPVTFTDQSQGGPNSWCWAFGDETAHGDCTSRDQNPTHTYANPGAYTIQLDISRDDPVAVVTASLTWPITVIACSFHLTPSPSPGLLKFGPGGDPAASIHVDTAAVCGWGGKLDSPSFIDFSGPTTLLGTGNLDYRVEPNPTGRVRFTSLAVAGSTYLIRQDGDPRAPCRSDGFTLCPIAGRFEVRATLSNPNSPGGNPNAKAVWTAGAGLLNAGYFWLSSLVSPELLVKVVSSDSGHYCVSFGGLTDLPYVITVRDSTSGLTKTYSNGVTGGFLAQSDCTTF